MERAQMLQEAFRSRMDYAPTACQEAFFREAAAFLTGDDGDILVVNGYAGTGKTTALSAVIAVMRELHVPRVLLAPTGRSAKVLSLYAGEPAYTIHKHIYRQRSVGENGLGEFALGYNKAHDALFVVDEVSLIGLDGTGGGASFGTGNLLEDLIRFVRSGAGCRLILVGDAAQLPPVGLDKSPALSPEYMSLAGGVRFCTLTTVVRQERQSGILLNATLLREKIADPGSGTFSPEDLGLRTAGLPDIVRLGGGELLETLSDAFGRYGEDQTIVLTRSNKRANRYNAGIRAQVQYKEEELVRGDKLMIVKNCYHFVGEQVEGMSYIANGDMAKLLGIRHFEDRYGLRFADARLCFSDYGDAEIEAKVCLDTLSSEAPALTAAQQNALWQGVLADYAHLPTKKKRYDAVKEDPFYNALQLKYAEAVTCHKAQGGQWDCVFIDNPFWQDSLTLDDLKWLYTALTRAVRQVYLVNFKDVCFKG